MFRRKRSVTGTVVPLIVVGAAVLAADFGRRLYRHTRLFCPSTEPMISWNPADYGIPEGAVKEHWIETADGEFLYAWYCRAETAIASAVFCHGNTGNLTTSADVIPHLLRAGVNVLFFDYRGFGKSTGRASFRGVISDGVTASRFHDTIRPKDLPSILYGYSLGGGVAAQVIRRHPFDALILQSTFTSLPQITRVLFPGLPLHLFAGNLFNTVEVMRNLQVPLLLVHGGDDEVCPPWMAREIFAACQSSKTLHIVDGALHKDIHLRDPDGLIRTISQFIAGLPQPGRTFSVAEPPLVEQWTDSALRTMRRLVRRRTPQQA
jgi:fermentation-respiration switch protein FrsA (DUF1100 family)